MAARPTADGKGDAEVRENPACMLIISGAKGGNRTPTGVTPQDPESCASTNSATFANQTAYLSPVISLGSEGCQETTILREKENE